MYTKVECYQRKIWLLVFSFMYLVLVDAMDCSYVMDWIILVNKDFNDQFAKIVPNFCQLEISSNER